MFNILIEYYNKYLEDGLVMPPRIKNNTMIYRDKIKNADDINSYIEERVCSVVDAQLKCKDIWNIFQDR